MNKLNEQQIKNRENKKMIDKINQRLRDLMEEMIGHIKVLEDFEAPEIVEMIQHQNSIWLQFCAIHNLVKEARPEFMRCWNEFKTSTIKRTMETLKEEENVQEHPEQ